MNGRIYKCDGCGRTGALDPDVWWYECPACRVIRPLPDERKIQRRVRKGEAIRWLYLEKWRAEAEERALRKPPPRLRRRDPNDPEVWQERHRWAQAVREELRKRAGFTT